MEDTHGADKNFAIANIGRHRKKIRDKLFQLYNLCMYGLNIRRFASHKPGDQTPLNGGC